MDLCCFEGVRRSVSGFAIFRFPVPLVLPPRSVAEDFAAGFIYCDGQRQIECIVRWSRTGSGGGSTLSDTLEVPR